MAEKNYLYPGYLVAVGISINPYIFTDAPSSLLSYCISLYSSSLNEFEMTAPIATWTIEPQTVITVAQPSTEVDWVDLNCKKNPVSPHSPNPMLSTSSKATLLFLVYSPLYYLLE